MLDRTIPFCNTIMKCSDYSPRPVELPDGFSIVSYQYGYENEWAKLEYASLSQNCGERQYILLQSTADLNTRTRPIRT